MVEMDADMPLASRSRTYGNLNAPQAAALRQASRKSVPNRRLSLVQRNVASCDFRELPASASRSRDRISGLVPGSNNANDPLLLNLDVKENANVADIKLSDYDRIEIWLDGHPEFVYDYFMRRATKRLVNAWLDKHADTEPGSRTELDLDSSANINDFRNQLRMGGNLNDLGALPGVNEMRLSGNYADTDLKGVDLNRLGFAKSQFASTASPSRKLSLTTFRREPVAFSRMQPSIPENSVEKQAVTAASNFVGVSVNEDQTHKRTSTEDSDSRQSENGSQLSTYETSHFVVGSATDLPDLTDSPKSLVNLELPTIEGGHRRARSELSRKRSYEPLYRPSININDLPPRNFATDSTRISPLSFDSHSRSTILVTNSDVSMKLEQSPRCESRAESEASNREVEKSSAESSRFLCDLLVDLCSTNDDAIKMCYRVALAVCQLVGCECSSLFTVASYSEGQTQTVDKPAGDFEAPADELQLPASSGQTERQPTRLVCRVLNVSTHTSFEDCVSLAGAVVIGSDREGASQQPLTVRVGPEGGLIGIVAQTGMSMRIDDAYSDERFNREMDVGIRSQSVLIMPIKTRDGELIGITVATNKLKYPILKKRSEPVCTLPTVTLTGSAAGSTDSNSSDRIRKQSVVQNDAPAPQRVASATGCSQRLLDSGCTRRTSQPDRVLRELNGSDTTVAVRKGSQPERDKASNCVPFTQDDETVLGRFVAVCALALRNAALFEKSQLENRRSEVLLELARCIFREQVDLHTLIYKIMMYAQSISRCERCQLLLIDDLQLGRPQADCKMGMFSQVYDLSMDEHEANLSPNGDSPRFPISLVVSEYVAITGETVNVADLDRDPRFSNAQVKPPNEQPPESQTQAQPEQKTSEASRRGPVHAKSLLCMPIKNGQDEVIGVCVLANKLGGGETAAFERDDERFFEAFTLFCGLGIHQTKMYERAIRAVAKQRVALEVLSYHATASIEESQRLLKMYVPSARYYSLTDFSFSDFTWADDDTLKCTLRMFIDLRLVVTFQIDYQVLCRFILSVKKNYRNVTYHNWRHAFNVAQSMFAIIETGAVEFLSDAERLGLLVACLCHDLDHRGTNNQFQIKSASALAQLYSTSVMEHHHFDQACMLLQAKGNEIFANLDSETLASVMRILESSILATDLAEYFRERGNFFKLVDSKADFSEPTNRATLRKMLMTACDVSAIYKPWDVQRSVAELVFSEFFEQGDLEKAELHLQPVDMMDRDKKDHLPVMQVNFIDSICMPIYVSLAKFDDRLSPMLIAVQANRRNWSMLAEAQVSNTSSNPPTVSSSASEAHNTGARDLNRPEPLVATDTGAEDKDKEKDQEKRTPHD